MACWCVGMNHEKSSPKSSQGMSIYTKCWSAVRVCLPVWPMQIKQGQHMNEWKISILTRNDLSLSAGMKVFLLLRLWKCGLRKMKPVYFLKVAPYKSLCDVMVFNCSVSIKVNEAPVDSVNLIKWVSFRFTSELY